MGPKSDKKGGGGGVKRKHVQLSIKDKLKILDQLENGTKPGVISLEFGIAKQTISDIKRNGEKLRKFINQREKDMPYHGYETVRLVRKVIIGMQSSSTQKQTKISSFFRPKTPTPPSTPVTPRSPVSSTSSSTSSSIAARRIVLEAVEEEPDSE